MNKSLLLTEVESLCEERKEAYRKLHAYIRSGNAANAKIATDLVESIYERINELLDRAGIGPIIINKSVNDAEEERDKELDELRAKLETANNQTVHLAKDVARLKTCARAVLETNRSMVSKPKGKLEDKMDQVRYTLILDGKFLNLLKTLTDI